MSVLRTAWAAAASATLFAAVFIVASPAAAQTLPSVDARTWAPSTDPRAGLATEPVQTPAAWDWNAGAWLRYDHHPISLGKAGTNDIALRPVSHLVGLDLTANLGIGARTSLAVSLPLVLFQDGSEPLPSSVVSTASVPSQALGDIGIHGKTTVVTNDDGGFGLALLAGAFLPTGDRVSFAGDGALRVTGRALAEYSFLLATIQGSLGYTLRTIDRTWPDAAVGGVRFGGEIPWTFGLTLHPDLLSLVGLRLDPGDRQVREIAAHGALPGGPVGPFGSGQPGSEALSPVMLAASDRVALGHYKDTFVLLGVDLGITNAVGVPNVRGVVGVGWAPRNHDKDGDGIADDVDKCPDIAEDKDGFEDSDGCPEIDDDDDGVIDREDACPRVAGAANPDPRKNGCPQPDADGDGVPDSEDACPNVKGFRNDDKRLDGCPAADRDGDGIPDALDKCVAQAEDRDGFQDSDGCPDPDDDGDGVTDKDDACPREPGSPSNDPKTNGCPSVDRDGDAIDDVADACPDVAEVYNGVKDDDGCPDDGGKPLVVIDEKDTRLLVRLSAPLKFAVGAGAGKPSKPAQLDASSLTLLRALVLELNRHREWTLGVGVRPGPGANASEAAQAQMERGLAVVAALNALAHRDGAAEMVAWSAAKDAVTHQPGAAASGIGFVILSTPAK